MRLILPLLLTLLLPTLCHAWGGEGHQLVALIAEDHLTPQAKAAVKELLDGGNISDAEVVNCADVSRRERGDTAPWHYVNIPHDAPAFDRAGDGRDDDNVIDAIERQAKVVADRRHRARSRHHLLRHGPLEHVADAVDLAVDVRAAPVQAHHLAAHGLQRDGAELGGGDATVQLQQRPDGVAEIRDLGRGRAVLAAVMLFGVVEERGDDFKASRGCSPLATTPARGTAPAASRVPRRPRRAGSPLWASRRRRTSWASPPARRNSGTA